MDAISGISGTSSFSFSTSSTGGTGSTMSDKQTFGAQVVSATLDKLNTGSGGSGNSDYDFQKTILTGKAVGIALDVTA